MTEFVRIDSNLDTILFFALKKLIDDGVCTPTTGMVGQNPDDNWIPPSVGFTIVSGRKQRLLNAECRTWSGSLTVRSYTFSALDIAMRDTINLTQRLGAGVQAANSRVISSLDMCDLTNGAVYFLAFPMRVNEQDDPRRTLVKGAAGQGWSYCEISFDFVYGEDPTYFNPIVNGVSEFTDEFTKSFT